LTEQELEEETAPGDVSIDDVVTVPDGLVAVPSGPQRADELAVPGYALIRRLGQGGMAEVHLAEKQGAMGVGIRCALKRILPSRSTDPRYRDRLLDEARILARLRHPNIVGVLDAGTVGDGVFVAMEWVDGIDVAALLELLRARGRELPLRWVLHVLDGALQGLHHAHTATDADGAPMQVIHRDVSPGNILCSRQGAVALTDFGVSTGTPTRRVERAGILSGKMPYFAPELFTGSPPSVQSDVFALGVTLWEMLTVRPLFPRRLGAEAMRDLIAAFHPDQLLEHDLTLPEPLEAVLRRCLAPRPADRYPSALAFLEDVHDFVHESGLRPLRTDFAAWLERLLDEGADGERRRAGAGGSR
jgi:serine/threonine protein kinase